MILDEGLYSRITQLHSKWLIKNTIGLHVLDLYPKEEVLNEADQNGDYPKACATSSEQKGEHFDASSGLSGPSGKAKKFNKYDSMEQGKPTGIIKPPRPKRYLTRILGSLFFVIIIGVALIGGVYYLLLGKTINSAAINEKVVASVQSLIGDKYKISVSQTRLRFKSLTSLAVSGNDISITKIMSQNTATSDAVSGATSVLASIGKMDVELDPLSLLSSTPKIKDVTVNKIIFDASQISNTGTQPAGVRSSLLKLFGATSKIEQSLIDGAFSSIEINNATVIGASLGRKQPDDIQISHATLKGKVDGAFVFSADVKSRHTDTQLKSSWSNKGGQGSVLSVEVAPINIREWLASAKIEPNTVLGIGSDAEFTVRAKIPFDGAGEPLQPTINAVSANSDLRIGKKHSTKLSSIDLSIRLLPASNQIQIERSSIKGEGSDISLIAGIIPADKKLGFSGPLNFDLVAEKITNEPVQKNVKTIPASALIIGQWDKSAHSISLESVQLIAEKKQIIGSALISLGGNSPAIDGYFETNDFPLDAIRQIWPFFVAAKPRKWIGEHFRGGYLKNAKVELAIPNGRIFGLAKHIPFKSGEIEFKAEFYNLDSDTFGKMPPLLNATGDVEVSGSRLSANVTSGKALSPAKNIVDFEMGRIAFNNFSEKNPYINIEVHLAGRLSTLMAVADHAPINAAKKILVKPADLSGDALVDVVTEFRLMPKGKIGELNWNALVTLEGASSDKPVLGRMFKNADMLLEITPNEIRGKGKAKIDGSTADISFVEPLGKSDVVAKLNVSTLFTQKQLKARGLDFDPIIKGPLALDVVSENNGVKVFTIDFTKADISLPWIGWLKGVGIPARANFELTEKNGVTTLSKFKLKGQGIDAQGKLVFNKTGLISANLKNITLVGDENFDVKISRSKGNFTIGVSGDSFDARGVINRVLHDDGLSEDKSNRDITLNAKFNTLIGFGGRHMNNSNIVYKTKNGLLSEFEISGKLNGTSSASVVAKRNGEITTFDIKSQNAGDALAMANVYLKMTGGTLDSKMQRQGSGPFKGAVKLRKFTVSGEKKLRAFANAPASEQKFKKASGALQKIDTKSVKFRSAYANIEKGPKYLKVSDGIIRSNEIGFTFEGTAFDAQDQMNIRGTFMPAIGISRLIGLIPIVGQILSNGKDGALLGITYRLRGSVKDPELAVNPMSLVTPGIFNKVFEFQE